MTVDEVLANLDRAGVGYEYRAGENGVLALCVCCGGEMAWTETWQRWVCDRPGCSSHDDPERIGRELYSRSNRNGHNGNGHRGSSSYPETLGTISKTMPPETAAQSQNGASYPPSAESGGKTAPSGRYEGRFLDLGAIERLLAEPPKPKPWRVHGLCLDGTLTMVSGEAAVGKSILLDNLCSGVAHGRAVIGMPCVKGTALYIDGEMGTDMFFDRYRDSGRSRADFLYVDALGLDLSIVKPDDLGWLRDVIQRTGAKFVVVDSLRRLVPSKNENESDDMAPALANLAKLARDTGAAVVVIHHKGDGEKFYRGSSAIRDQVDALYGLISVNPDDDDDRRVRLTCRGARGKPPRSAGEQPDRFFEVSFKDGGITEAEQPGPAGPKISVRESVANEIVAAMPAESKAEAARKVGRKPNDLTFRNAWADAEDAERIVHVSGIWQSSSYLETLGLERKTTTGSEGVA